MCVCMHKCVSVHMCVHVCVHVSARSCTHTMEPGWRSEDFQVLSLFFHLVDVSCPKWHHFVVGLVNYISCFTQLLCSPCTPPRVPHSRLTTSWWQNILMMSHLPACDACWDTFPRPVFYCTTLNCFNHLTETSAPWPVTGVIWLWCLAL